MLDAAVPIEAFTDSYDPTVEERERPINSIDKYALDAGFNQVIKRAVADYAPK